MTTLGGSTKTTTVPSPKCETKQKFQKLYKKYQFLWNSLTTDQAVVQEYQLLLKFTQKQEEAVIDVVEAKGVEENIPVSDNSSSSTTTTSISNGVNQEDEYESDDDGEEDDDDEEEKKYDENQKDSIQNLISQQQVLTNSIVDECETTKDEINNSPAYDFLSAIATASNNQKSGLIFRVSPSYCCNITGCDNNCAEPILEEIEDDGQTKTNDKNIQDGIDSAENGVVDVDIDDIQIQPQKFDNDGGDGDYHYQRVEEQLVGVGENGGVGQEGNGRDDSSSVSSSSSSSGGPSVITFDLSHLSIKDEGAYEMSQNADVENEDSEEGHSDNHTIGLDDNSVTDETLIQNERVMASSATVQSTNSTINSVGNYNHDENMIVNGTNDSKVDDKGFQSKVSVRKSFSPSNRHEEMDTREIVSSPSSSSSLEPNLLSFNEDFEKELHLTNTASGEDRNENKDEDITSRREEEEQNFGEESLSSSDDNSDDSSSSGGSTVVRFKVDVSVFTDHEGEDGKDRKKEGIHHDLEDGGNEIHHEAENNIDGQSLNTLSSEEAEWTENEDNCNEDDLTSSQNGELPYNVVILSTDESIGEEGSYEEEDSFEFADEESELSNEEESDDNESESTFNMFDKEESRDSGYGNDDDILILESEEDIDNIIEVESRSTDYNSPSQEHQTKIRSSHHKSKSAFKFQSQRDLLTNLTFDDFNRIVFENALKSVEVTWSKRLTSTAGITRLRKKKTSTKIEYTASIELSTKLIDNEERLRATLMHEMCHAAAWLVDNVHKPPHGKVRILFRTW